MIKKLTYFFLLLILILPIANALSVEPSYQFGFLQEVNTTLGIVYTKPETFLQYPRMIGVNCWYMATTDNLQLKYSLDNNAATYSGPEPNIRQITSSGQNFPYNNINVSNAIVNVYLGDGEFSFSCFANFTSITIQFCSYTSGCNSTNVYSGTNSSVGTVSLNLTNYINAYKEKDFYLTIYSSGGIFRRYNYLDYMSEYSLNLSLNGNTLLAVKDLVSGEFIDDVTTTTYYNNLVDTRTFNKSTVFNLGNYNLNTVITALGYSNNNALLNYGVDYLAFYTAYLVETTYLQDVVIYVKDEYEQIINGATITVYKASDNSIVYSKFTDLSGSAGFSLDERLEYRIEISKNNYVTTEDIFYPLENTYFFTLLSQSSTPPTNLELGRFFSWTPNGNNLNSNTAYNITYNVTNATNQYVDFTNISLSVYDQDGAFISVHYVNSTNESFVTIPNFNTSNYSKIFIVAELNINNSFLYQQRQYLIHQSYTGDYSLASVRTILNQFTDSGFDDNTRNLIGIIILLIVMIGTGTLVVTEADTSKALLLFFSLTLLLSYFNLLSMNLIINMDAQLGGDAAKTMWNQYGISIIVGIFALGKLIKELNIQR